MLRECGFGEEGSACREYSGSGEFGGESGLSKQRLESKNSSGRGRRKGKAEIQRVSSVFRGAVRE